jgi:hypothetical protein
MFPRLDTPRSRTLQLRLTRLNHGFLRHNDRGLNTDSAQAVYYARIVSSGPNGVNYLRVLPQWQLLSFALLVLLAPLGADAQNTNSPPPPPPQLHDGEHDFDFEIGTWKTHLRRLLHPLTGSTTWVEYEGTTVVRKVWDGRANLLELVADGPAGHFEGLNLRLYNPESRQWSLNFANSRGGTIGVPTIGEFKNGRGEFYDQETLNGRAILVRFVISDITADSCHFEQAFSDDGGKTWEVNWIANDTRVKAAR